MNLLLTASYFIHLIATVVWLGGLLIFSLLVYPEARRTLTNHNENRQLLLNLQKRFRPIANLSLVTLLGTGLIQMSADANYKGLLVIENTWSVAILLKHIAFGGMIVVLLVLQFGVMPALERAMMLASKGKPNELDALLAREAKLTWLQMGLGGLVLIFTAVATAL
ncbi:MAG: hypothetical protein L0154_28550 [Chloroflexi bacterium]|nr:hypothetical protein [Chloroflexota bacterium]